MFFLDADLLSKTHTYKRITIISSSNATRHSNKSQLKEKCEKLNKIGSGISAIRNDLNGTWT